jgi:hypothetical protein
MHGYSAIVLDRRISPAAIEIRTVTPSSFTGVPPSAAGLAMAANPDAALPPASVCGSNANILSTRTGELCGVPLGKGR